MLNPIEEVKNRLDIVEVIGSYIKLQKAGVNYRALCPFHSEKKPSLFVSPTRQIWHCFGCGKGGSIFNFVMEIEGVEFGDALRILAQKAGVELKRQPPELKTERQRLYEICELASRFFEKQLGASKVGQEAKKYLLSRGISEESIKKWRIGYAPDTWEGLSDFLVSKGYQREEIEKAGLAIKSETTGNFFDRFQGRIIFPIFDLNSQIIGFGGRIFGQRAEKEIAKYVNIPNTLLYDKSRVVYGLDRAKVEIRKRDFCILVEGYTDVITASQAGFENVVATSGTALTPYQLKILKRYSENLITAFDMDLAGDSATKRGINLAQAQGFNIKVILMPKDSDPADLISKNPKNWQKLVESAKSILDFYFETTFSRSNPKTPEGKREIARILLPVIKQIPNKILEAHWIQNLAKKLEVKEGDIETELKKIKSEIPEIIETEETSPVLPQKSRKELLEERISTLFLKSPQSISFVEDKKPEPTAYFVSGKMIELIGTPEIKEIFLESKKNPGIDLRKTPLGATDIFNTLSLKAEIEEIEEKDIIPEIKNCWEKLQSLEIKNKLDLLTKEIKTAEEEKDFKKINDLTQKFKDTASELTSL